MYQFEFIFIDMHLFFVVVCNLFVNGKDEPLSTRTVLLPEILSLKDSLSGRLWVLLAEPRGHLDASNELL